MPKGFIAKLRWTSTPRTTNASDVENQKGFVLPWARGAVGDRAIPLTSTRNHERNSSESTNLQLLIPPSERVDVRVGTGYEAKTFQISKKLLCENSGYFKKLCSTDSKERIDFDDDDPVVFGLFLKWIRNPAAPITYNPEGQLQKPWLSHSAEAWLLGKKLRATASFQRYSLSQFIQTCAVLPFGPWEKIEKEAPSRSPLRRFSDHWVAWNSRLFGPGTNEFSHLHAARRAHSVPEMARDPRIYDIEHWYSRCGDDLKPGCKHDPIARQEKIDEANRPPPAPLARWGASFEAARTGLPLAARDVNVNANARTNTRTNANKKTTKGSNILGRSNSRNIGSRSTRAGTTTNVRKTFAKTAGSLLGGFFFGGQVIAAIMLAVFLFKEIDDGVRHTTRTYTLFVASLYGLNFICPIIWPAYCFFAFASGCAMAVDLKSCRNYANTQGGFAYDYNYGIFIDINDACKSIEALTILIWISIPMSAGWFRVVRWILFS